MSKERYRLCYVDDFDNDWEPRILELYFTSLPLDKQWGDDWDDAPYEHNAGTPYTEDYSQPEIKVENGCGVYPKIKMKKLFLEKENYKQDLLTPRTRCTNSPYSVKDINFGAAPWITIKEEGKNPVFIRAGMEYNQVIKQCQLLDIKVYVRKEKRNGQTKSNERS